MGVGVCLGDVRKKRMDGDVAGVYIVQSDKRMFLVTMKENCIVTIANESGCDEGIDP